MAKSNYTDGYSDKTIQVWNADEDKKKREDKRGPIQIRQANAEDVDFIFSSWLKSYRGSLLFSKVQSSIYFPEMHKLIEKLLTNFPVLIACSTEDETQIFGWICAGEVQGIFCLHYIYVKHTYRKLGVAKLLFNSFKHDAAGMGLYTHTSKLAEQLAPKYNLIHHPFILLNDYISPVKEAPLAEEPEVVEELQKLEGDVDNEWVD